MTPIITGPRNGEQATVRPPRVVPSAFLLGVLLLGLLRLQFLQGFSRCQVPAGESGETGGIAKGTEERLSARGTAPARSAGVGASPHRLELLLLVFREQRLEPRVDLLLDRLQTAPLRGGELQRV